MPYFYYTRIRATFQEFAPKISKSEYIILPLKTVKENRPFGRLAFLNRSRLPVGIILKKSVCLYRSSRMEFFHINIDKYSAIAYRYGLNE